MAPAGARRRLAARFHRPGGRVDGDRAGPSAVNHLRAHADLSGGAPVADVSASLLLFAALYLGLAVALVVLLLRLARTGRPAPAPALPPGRGRWRMPLEDLVAAAGLCVVILYGVLAGADFGGGVWD